MVEVDRRDDADLPLFLVAELFGNRPIGDFFVMSTLMELEWVLCPVKIDVAVEAESGANEVASYVCALPATGKDKKLGVPGLGESAGLDEAFTLSTMPLASFPRKSAALWTCG